MTLTERIQQQAAIRHLRDGERAQQDPHFASLMARARLRLRRELIAHAPGVPELSAADLQMVAAIARAGLPPITAILSGEDRVGARQIAARLDLLDGEPHVHVGVAVLDEWGELTFLRQDAPALG